MLQETRPDEEHWPGKTPVGEKGGGEGENTLQSHNLWVRPNIWE